MPRVVLGELANGASFHEAGFGSSDPEAALPEMLDVALVQDPLAVRKLGEVQIAAEWAASSDDDHIVGGYCLTAASPQYSNHPCSARFFSSVKGE